jgi:hypothetical protein
MRLSTTLRYLVGLAICGTLGCGSDLSTAVVVSDLNGFWMRLGNVPGSSEHWTLSATDTVVAGTGSWTGEACCSGTLTIAGYVSRDSVHLFITHVVTAGASIARDPFQTQFNGTFESPTLLVGRDGERFQKQ